MKIAKVIVHPEFDISQLTNDIALIKLDEHVDFENRELVNGRIQILKRCDVYIAAF